MVGSGAEDISNTEAVNLLENAVHVLKLTTSIMMHSDANEIRKINNHLHSRHLHMITPQKVILVSTLLCT